MNKEEITKDIKKYKAVEAVANSDGGKIIEKDIKDDLISVIDQISVKYGELSHIELIALCAGLNEKLTMLRIFKNAKTNRKMAIEALEDED